MKKTTQFTGEDAYRFGMYLVSTLFICLLVFIHANNQKDTKEQQEAKEQQESKENLEFYRALHQGSDSYNPMWTPASGAAWKSSVDELNSRTHNEWLTEGDKELIGSIAVRDAQRALDTEITLANVNKGLAIHELRNQLIASDAEIREWNIDYFKQAPTTEGMDNDELLDWMRVYDEAFKARVGITF